MVLGSKGVFVIRWDERRKRFTDGSDAYGYEFPAVEKYQLKPGEVLAPDFPPYPEALAYARSVERAAKAPRAEQISLLEMYAKDSVTSPTRSVWAIATLAGSGVESAHRFLFDLAKNLKISTFGQLALDEQLQTLDKSGQVTWSRTPARLALWQRLVTSPQSEVEAVSIANDLLHIASEESREREQVQRANRTYTLALSGPQLFQWLRLAADNPKWTPFSRSFAIRNVGELYKLGNDYSFELIPRSTTWMYLLPLLQSHPDFNESKPSSAESRELSAKLAQGALATMGNLRPFTPTEEATLRALQAKAKAARLKRIFDLVFDKQG